MLTKPITHCARCRAVFDEPIRLEHRTGYDAALARVGWLCQECELEAELERHNARLEQHRARAYDACMLTRSSRDHTFDLSDYAIERENLDAYASARRGVATRSLWLCGPTGVGKTYLAHCILNAEVDRFGTAAEVSAVRFALDADSFDFKRPVALATANVLLVDDFDKPSWRPRALAALFELLDVRASHKRRVVITANQRGMEVRRRMIDAMPDNPTFAEALFDRLCPIAEVQLTGKSARRRI